MIWYGVVWHGIAWYGMLCNGYTPQNPPCHRQTSRSRAHREYARLELDDHVRREGFAPPVQPRDLRDRFPLNEGHHLRPQRGRHVADQLVLVATDPMVLPVHGKPARRSTHACPAMHSVKGRGECCLEAVAVLPIQE